MNARDELAKLLFAADNHKATDGWGEWEFAVRCDGVEPYYVMADALIAEGYSNDSCCCGTCGL